MTYSVGFRAPSIAELLSHFCDQAIADLSDNQRYQDPDLQQQENPGEICHGVIKAIRHALVEQFSDDEKVARWFGQYMTSPKHTFEHEQDGGAEKIDLQRCFARYPVIYRNPASRFAYIKTVSGLLLFVDGEEYVLSRDQLAFVQLLCGKSVIASEVLVPFLRNRQSCDVLSQLYRQNCLYFDENNGLDE